MAEKASSKKIYIIIVAALCILVLISACIFLSHRNKAADIDLSEVHSAELDNKKMASGVMPLSDGSEVTVELWLTSGRYYDEYSDDFLPSIYTYSHNYEGTYELLTVNEDGDILFRTDLKELWTDSNDTSNFPYEFELEWTDYNSDGCPDFSIGMPFSSSSMGFLLLTVQEDGSLNKLCSEEILLNSFEKFSVVFEHDVNADGMPITGYFYNNVIGETENIIYYYNAQNGLYEAE